MKKIQRCLASLALKWALVESKPIMIFNNSFCLGGFDIPPAQCVVIISIPITITVAVIMTVIIYDSRGPAEWMVLVGLHGVAKAKEMMIMVMGIGDGDDADHDGNDINVNLQLSC